MRCPFCAAANTRVADTRLAGDGDEVRRRRECAACGERFTTYEKVELVLPRVVKSDGSRQPFDPAKLRTGMLRALEKRPVDTDAVEAAIARIGNRLCAAGDREVPARRLGEWVMQALRDLDQVAYVRFASVYRRFEDVSAFREEIDRLEREPSPEARQQQLSLLPDEAGTSAARGAAKRRGRGARFAAGAKTGKGHGAGAPRAKKPAAGNRNRT